MFQRKCDEGDFVFRRDSRFIAVRQSDTAASYKYAKVFGKCNATSPQSQHQVRNNGCAGLSPFQSAVKNMSA